VRQRKGRSCSKAENREKKRGRRLIIQLKRLKQGERRGPSEIREKEEGAKFPSSCRGEPPYPQQRTIGESTYEGGRINIMERGGQRYACDITKIKQFH